MMLSRLWKGSRVQANADAVGHRSGWLRLGRTKRQSGNRQPTLGSNSDARPSANSRCHWWITYANPGYHPQIPLSYPLGLACRQAHYSPWRSRSTPSIISSEIRSPTALACVASKTKSATTTARVGNQISTGQTAHPRSTSATPTRTNRRLHFRHLYITRDRPPMLFRVRLIQRIDVLVIPSKLLRGEEVESLRPYVYSDLRITEAFLGLVPYVTALLDFVEKRFNFTSRSGQEARVKSSETHVGSLVSSGHRG